MSSKAQKHHSTILLNFIRSKPIPGIRAKMKKKTVGSAPRIHKRELHNV